MGSPFMDAPAWLLDRIASEEKMKPFTAPPVVEGATSAYGRAALQDECGKVALAQDGTRNDTFNAAAFACAQLVAGGELDRAEAEAALLHAAERAGLTEAEARKTIASGFNAGEKDPRTAPESKGSMAKGQKPATATAAPLALVVVNVADLLTLKLPERGHVLHPVIPEQGLVMLYAPRGVGKTWASLSIAYGAASGQQVFGRWSAPRPRRVLYLDGEMPAAALQERLAAIVAGSSGEPPAPDFLTILTPDLQPDFMPNLATEEGQAAVAPFLEGVDMVVVDNLATLGRHGRENETESWLPLQNWLLGLRRSGKSVLVVHHAGKGGNQRGTSAKEDILDTVIALRRPDDYESEAGARFEVHLEKARGVFGPEAKPFEAALRTDHGAATWTTRDIEDVELERVRRLKAEGMSIRDIAEETGMSKSRVQRLAKKLDRVAA